VLGDTRDQVRLTNGQFNKFMDSFTNGNLPINAAIDPAYIAIQNEICPESKGEFFRNCLVSSFADRLTLCPKLDSNCPLKKKEGFQIIAEEKRGYKSSGKFRESIFDVNPLTRRIEFDSEQIIATNQIIDTLPIHNHKKKGNKKSRLNTIKNVLIQSLLDESRVIDPEFLEQDIEKNHPAIARRMEEHYNTTLHRAVLLMLENALKKSF